MASTNNNLSYVGITQLDAKNPLRHTFDVKDEHRTGEYEVKFTKSEYESKKTICKPVERLSGRFYFFGEFVHSANNAKFN